MNGKARLSRREALKVGGVFAVGATVVLTTGVGTAGAAETAPADAGSNAGTGKRGDLARVTAVGGTGAGAARAGVLRVATPAAPVGNALRAAGEEVPCVGFPDNFTLRAGDLVTVTDQWPGVAMAAVPVCRWVTGVPKRQRNGDFTVAGRRVVESPLLREGKRIRVCLLDTELPNAQVLKTLAA